MFIVLTGVLVLISMLFNGCFYKMCCFLLSCGTTGKFLSRDNKVFLNLNFELEVLERKATIQPTTSHPPPATTHLYRQPLA